MPADDDDDVTQRLPHRDELSPCAIDARKTKLLPPYYAAWVATRMSAQSACLTEPRGERTEPSLAHDEGSAAARPRDGAPTADLDFDWDADTLVRPL